MELKEAKTIVTGGASGLGLATAKRLVQGGARVAILDLDGTRAQAAAAELGQRAFVFETDVTSEASVEAAVAGAVESMGSLTLAVNCAGIIVSQRTVGKDKRLSLEDFNRVLAVNLSGTFLICRAAAGHMQHNAPTADGERGVIVNTASIAAFEGQIGQAAYAASKAAVAGMTLPLAREFAVFGVRVMTVAPGLFDTLMVAGLPETARAALGAQAPFPHRLGKPEEFAALVCHIYENPMLNGEVIRLDAALRMPPK